MIEQQRTMEVPGAGIVRDGGPTTQHSEYPKHMRHPGYQRGTPDKEIKVVDETGRPTGQLRYAGGTSIRLPPVLVLNESQEEFHKSQGYETVGKSDPAAFARLVADAEPVQDNYKPIEYPKWSHGKLVRDAAEEADHLAALGIDKMGRPVESETMSEPVTGEPALETEANTLEVWPAVQGAAAGAESTSPKEREPWEEEIVALKAKIAALEAEKAPPVVTEPEQASASSTAPPEMTRGEKIKAGIARKKAEREAAEQAKALQDEVQAEAGEEE